MGKLEGSRPSSASHPFTHSTRSLNWSRPELPAPVQPSPYFSARRIAGSALAPNHSGGCGLRAGLGSMLTPSSW